MNEPDPAALTITSALDCIRTGEITMASLVCAYRVQIERFNPNINAFVCVTENEPASDPDHKNTFPVPVAVKDLIDVAGLPTTAGSPMFFGKNPARADAFVVEKLRQAGAFFLGKTNTHEIALGVTGVNPHLGVVRNPHDPSRVTGGSSSGSAAAVAAGMCLAALGTDTGGSIRIPASLCGVVGLKPTHGRVSTRGVLPLSWNLDHVGPLTRSMRDAAMMLQVMAGYDPLDPVSVNVPVDDYLTGIDDGIKDWHVAIATGDYIEASDPEVLSFLRETGRVLKDSGALIVQEDLSWISDLAYANGCMTQADAAAFHSERMATHPEWFGEDVRSRLEKGAATTASEYINARRLQVEGRRRFDLFFQSYDLLLLPTTPIPAPPIEGTDAVEAARQLTRFTAPFNLTGLPALSVPCGLTRDNLPVGLQLVSRAWAETKILRAGCVLEKSFGSAYIPSLTLT
jgi:aspartyl-tRNA(Asn)/glutamyl-tRNA(Gln) amidotransferase subunit A